MKLSESEEQRRMPQKNEQRNGRLCTPLCLATTATTGITLLAFLSSAPDMSHGVIPIVIIVRCSAATIKRGSLHTPTFGGSHPAIAVCSQKNTKTVNAAKIHLNGL